MLIFVGMPNPEGVFYAIFMAKEKNPNFIVVNVMFFSVFILAMETTIWWKMKKREKVKHTDSIDSLFFEAQASLETSPPLKCDCLHPVNEKSGPFYDTMMKRCQIHNV